MGDAVCAFKCQPLIFISDKIIPGLSIFLGPGLAMRSETARETFANTVQARVWVAPG